MTLNTKKGFIDFLWYPAARHISRANCAEITSDRPGQPVYKIFSVKRRFQRFKSWPRGSRRSVQCAWRHQKVLIL